MKNPKNKTIKRSGVVLHVSRSLPTSCGAKIFEGVTTHFCGRVIGHEGKHLCDKGDFVTLGGEKAKGCGYRWQ